MKSKLEEKKLQFLDDYCKSDGFCRSDASDAFDAGVAVYKEMLEGVGVDGAMIKFLHYPNYIDGTFHSKEGHGMIKFIEALPVLAKLQQQAEKIELFESSYVQCSSCGDTYVLARDLKNSEVELFKKITELETRLKEAESVIKFYAKDAFRELSYNSGYCVSIVESDTEDILGNLYAGKLARQYMEKVK